MIKYFLLTYKYDPHFLFIEKQQLKNT